MILGIGTDIANIGRFAKTVKEHGKRFAEKCFSEREIEKAEAKAKNSIDEYNAFLAKHWAAKEALVKALGYGFRDGIYLKDIEVLNDNLGKPYIELSGGAKKAFEKSVPQGYSAKVHLTVSDDYPMVVAFVIIECEKN